MSTFSPNLDLELVGRGEDVGTWDTPTNSNWSIVDLGLGGITTVSLNNTNVTLSAAQFQSKQITFSSTLTGSVVITFPTSFTKSYEIQNLCTGSSAFIITLTTTATGGQAICPPPGETIDCFNDGTNIKFKNLGRIGEYMDIAGSSMPAWIDGCTVPPYLNCTGATFSSSTYPQLAVRLGGTTLPDSRSRARIPIAQSATRVTSAVAGFDGGTLFAAGGDQSMQTHNHQITDPGHLHAQQSSPAGGVTGILGQAVSGAYNTNAGSLTGNNVTGITINTTGNGSAQNMPPTYVHGLTLIRAA